MRVGCDVLSALFGTWRAAGLHTCEHLSKKAALCAALSMPA